MGQCVYMFLAGKGLGDESLYYAVVNYCKKNPLHSTVDAAEFIYERQLD